jgi:hypothetical protein
MRMRTTLAAGAATVLAVGVAPTVLAVGVAPTALASGETAQETIDRLQSQGYTVTVDRVGTGPLEDCTVTNVRNPQRVTQWVPYVGPTLGGARNETVLVEVVTSQTVSVSLDCTGR